MKKILIATMAVFSVMLGAYSNYALANTDSPVEFSDESNELVQRGRILDLGVVMIGRPFGRTDVDTIDIVNNRRIECNLSHVRLIAMRDDVRILRLDVQYRNGQWESRHFRRGGAFLGRWQSTRWIDVDRFDDRGGRGRCVDRIRIWGQDTGGFLDRLQPARVRVEGLVQNFRRRW